MGADIVGSARHPRRSPRVLMEHRSVQVTEDNVRMRRRVLGSSRLRADQIAVTVFLVAVLLGMVPRWHYDNWLTEYDIFTFFLPWYGMVGDRLRDLDIPGWPPYFLSGMPLAGDASAGWMYAPVMLAFSLLSVTTAFKTMVLIQVLIGGLSTYALSRVLGFAPIAALVSMTAFAFGPFLAGQTDYTTIGGQVSTWIPVALLGIELSLRAPRLISRFAWWSLSGFAVSQIAVSWPGQGLINALLIVAGWVVYRAVLSPPEISQAPTVDATLEPVLAPRPSEAEGAAAPLRGASTVGRSPSTVRKTKRVTATTVRAARATSTDVTLTSSTGFKERIQIPGMRTRVLWAVVTGIALVGIGLALGAAGILPRLDVNAQSSIPNGDYSHVLYGEYNPPASVYNLLSQIFADARAYRPTNYSGAVLVLAMLAFLISLRRHCVPFFGSVWIVGTILAMHETPLHRLFYLIPQFERIHEHSPQRLLWVITLAPAMLAGATVQTLIVHPPKRFARLLVLLPLAATVAIGIYLTTEPTEHLTAKDPKVGWLPYASAIVAAILVLVATHPWPTRPVRSHAMGRYALVGIIALVFLFPAGSDVVASVFGIHSLRPLMVTDAKTDQIIDTYFSRTDPGGAGEFLQAEQQQGKIFRYVSYAGRDPATNQPSYSTWRLKPTVLAVLVNGRAARLGLESIQGYNPSHLLVYDQYVANMNGGYQNYHWSDPFRDALGPNPLMDMLNVRYILVDATIPEGRWDIALIANGRRVVFRNTHVVIYENPDAFPRAWIVHDVRPETPGSLAELKSGQVDGRQVAFVDGPLPNVSQPTSGEDSVRITGRSGDRLTASASTSAPGLVVFSEIYAKGWHAYVDGKQVDVIQTNHALRGVAVDAGTHRIELRYEPRSLQIGLWITVITAIGMLGVSVLAIGTWMRSRTGYRDRS